MDPGVDFFLSFPKKKRHKDITSLTLLILTVSKHQRQEVPFALGWMHYAYATWRSLRHGRLLARSRNQILIAIRVVDGSLLTHTHTYTQTCLSENTIIVWTCHVAVVFNTFFFAK